jgi:hypothetical protein
MTKRPELNTAVLANTFEWFTDAGKDDQLLASRSIPLPIRDDGAGGDLAKEQGLIPADAAQPSPGP